MMKPALVSPPIWRKWVKMAFIVLPQVFGCYSWRNAGVLFSNPPSSNKRWKNRILFLRDGDLIALLPKNRFIDGFKPHILSGESSPKLKHWCEKSMGFVRFFVGQCLGPFCWLSPGNLLWHRGQVSTLGLCRSMPIKMPPSTTKLESSTKWQTFLIAWNRRLLAFQHSLQNSKILNKVWNQNFHHEAYFDKHKIFVTPFKTMIFFGNQWLEFVGKTWKNWFCSLFTVVSPTNPEISENRWVPPG